MRNRIGIEIEMQKSSSLRMLSEEFFCQEVIAMYLFFNRMLRDLSSPGGFHCQFKKLAGKHNMMQQSIGHWLYRHTLARNITIFKTLIINI